MTLNFFRKGGVARVQVTPVNCKASTIKRPKISAWPRQFLTKFRGHVRTVPGNMFVKFEVCIFSRIGAISV